MNRLVTFLSIIAISFSISCTNRLEVHQLKNVKEHFQKYKRYTEKDKSRLQKKLETCKERAQEIRVEWFRTIVSRVGETIKLYEHFCVHREDFPQNNAYICTQLSIAHRLIKKTRRTDNTILDNWKVPPRGIWVYLGKKLNKLELKVEKYLYHAKYCNWQKD